jgi:hypothetical protein
MDSGFRRNATRGLMIPGLRVPLEPRTWFTNGNGRFMLGSAELGQSRGRSMDGSFGKRSDVVAPRSWLNPLPAAAVAALMASMLVACQPTVKVEAPDKPIVINLNVKIEQEVRVKIDKEVEDLLKTQPDLF